MDCGKGTEVRKSLSRRKAAALRPGASLELTGAFAMRDAAYSKVSFEIAEKNGGAVVKLTHRCFGQISPDTEKGYGEGWADLLGTRLKHYVETGEQSGYAASY